VWCGQEIYILSIFRFCDGLSETSCIIAVTYIHQVHTHLAPTTHISHRLHTSGTNTRVMTWHARLWESLKGLSAGINPLLSHESNPWIASILAIGPIAGILSNYCVAHSRPQQRRNGTTPLYAVFSGWKPSASNRLKQSTHSFFHRQSLRSTACNTYTPQIHKTELFLFSNLFTQVRTSSAGTSHRDSNLNTSKWQAKVRGDITHYIFPPQGIVELQRQFLALRRAGALPLQA